MTSNSNQELACIYTALALQDDGVPIVADKIQAIVKAAGIEIKPFWAGLYAKALEGVDVKSLISNIGSGVGAAATGVGGKVMTSATVDKAGSPAAAKEEKKKEEPKEESDDDMGFGLFDKPQWLIGRFIKRRALIDDGIMSILIAWWQRYNNGSEKGLREMLKPRERTLMINVTNDESDELGQAAAAVSSVPGKPKPATRKIEKPQPQKQQLPSKTSNLPFLISGQPMLPQLNPGKTSCEKKQKSSRRSGSKKTARGHGKSKSDRAVRPPSVHQPCSRHTARSGSSSSGFYSYSTSRTGSSYSSSGSSSGSESGSSSGSWTESGSESSSGSSSYSGSYSGSRTSSRGSLNSPSRHVYSLLPLT